jgi:hypothetical protein
MKNKQVCLKNSLHFFMIVVIALGIIAIIFSGCGGGNHNPSNSGNDTNIGTEITVQLFKASDLQTPIYTTVTGSASLENGGSYNLPISSLQDNTLYIVLVSGINDLDGNYDGNGSAHSSLHMAALGAEIKQGNFNVNILTDLVYYQVSYLIFAQYQQETILTEMDRCSRMLLSKDFDNSGKIDRGDLRKWNPTNNKDALRLGWDSIGAYMNAVLSGTSLSTKTIAAPVSGVIGMIDTGSNQGNVIAVSGSFAYVVDNSLSFQVVDISNPSKPFVLGAVILPSVYLFKDCKDITISGNHAYVITSENLHVIDISNPSAPVIVGSIAVYAYGMAVSGNYAFLTSPGILEVIDISNPTAPTSINRLFINIGGNNIAISGNYAFTSDEVIDISDPSSPNIIGNLQGYSGYVRVHNNYAYISNGNGLNIIDISNPNIPSHISTVATTSDVVSMAISGKYVYISDGMKVQVIDISDPFEPFWVKSITPFGSISAMAASNNSVYLTGDPIFQAIDISDSMKQFSVGSSPTKDNAYDVTMSGNYTYISEEYSNGNEIFDISNPNSPSLIGTLDSSAANDIAISGRYAYVADGDLRIFDISDPESPSEVGLLEMYNARSIEISSNYAYVTELYFGLKVIDISDPYSPTIVGDANVGSYQNSSVKVAVSGNYAYVVNHGSLEVIDISIPNAPKVDAILSGSTFLGLAISGNYLYVTNTYFESTNNYYDLNIIDISNPKEPVVVQRIGISDFSDDIAVSGNYLYLTERVNGIQVINVSDPSNPFVIAYLNTPGYTTGIEVIGGYALVADGFAGLEIYKAK